MDFTKTMIPKEGAVLGNHGIYIGAGRFTGLTWGAGSAGPLFWRAAAKMGSRSQYVDFVWIHICFHMWELCELLVSVLFGAYLGFM